MAQQLYNELLSQIEGLMQQVKASEVEFEHKLSQPLEQVSTVKIEEEPPLAQEGSTLGDGSESSLEHTEDIPAESEQPNQIVEQADTSELEEKIILSADSQDKPTYDKEVEVEILPPLDIKQIMAIMRHLDSTAEVESTELIPLTDKPVIVISLREPTQLIELLRTFPEVAEVQEVTNEGVADNADATYAEDKRRKIQITLSGNSVPDDAKERLNSTV